MDSAKVCNTTQQQNLYYNRWDFKRYNSIEARNET